MRITKQEVIEAIRTEPLQLAQHAWASNGDFNTRDTIDTACRVCAVGAVLRQRARRDLTFAAFSSMCFVAMGGSPSSTNDSNLEKFINAALFRQEYLAALSLYFESGKMRRKNQAARRSALVTFVKNHFPDVLDLPKLDAYTR